MSDVVYSVEVQFLQNGNFSAPAAGLDSLKGKANSLTKSLLSGAEEFASKFNSALIGLGGAVLGLGEKVAVGLAGGLAIGMVAATKASIDFNEQMENARLSLGAIAQANGLVDNLGGGMRVAGDVLSQMRKDARDLPGEFKDLENIMANIAGPGAQLGLSMDSMEKMSAKTMASAAVLNVPQQVAAREMAMMLAGNARHNMPLFQKMPMGMEAKEFNKLDPKKRLQTINDALNKIATPEAVGLMQSSFTGLKTTLMDMFRQSVGAIGGPLFGSLKDTMSSFIGWTRDHSDELAIMGEKLGISIDNAFNNGLAWIKKWYPVVEEFGKVLYNHVRAALDQFKPMLKALGVDLEKMASNPEGTIEGAIKAAKIGGGMLMAGNVAEAGFGAIPGMAALAGGGEAGAAALGAAAGPAAIAVAALAAAAYGAFDILTDTFNELHGVGMYIFNDTKKSFIDLGHQLSVLGTHLKPLADLLGVALLGAIDLTVKALDGLVWVGNLMFDAFNQLNNAVQWLLEKLHIANQRKLGDEEPEKYDHAISGYIGGAVAPNAFIKWMDADANSKNHPKVPTTQVHVGKVEIKVESNQDPNRIAKRTADIIFDLARHPKIAQATGVPVYSR